MTRHVVLSHCLSQKKKDIQKKMVDENLCNLLILLPGVCLDQSEENNVIMPHQQSGTLRLDMYYALTCMWGILALRHCASTADTDTGSVGPNTAITPSDIS